MPKVRVFQSRDVTRRAGGSVVEEAAGWVRKVGAPIVQSRAACELTRGAIIRRGRALPPPYTTMTHVIPTVADALAASVALAARLALPTNNPVVVAEGYSVRVRLDPAPVLTRVITVGRVLRGAPRPWMEREIAVSEYLATAGAPVAPPWEDAGLHEAYGLEVSLWRWLEPVPQPIFAETFGHLLKDLHDTLATYTGSCHPSSVR